MKDLIIMTIALSIGMGIYLYIFTRDKVFCVWLALSGISATIPLFFHLKYNFGYAWLIWIIFYGIIIVYLGKKYPNKMKEWEKHFRLKK